MRASLLAGVLLLAVVVALLRCRSSGGSATDGAACGTATTLRVLSPGQKVCQLAGDQDRALGQPTENLTFSRFGLSNTDLGASFEHHGKLWFLFGDSWPSGGDAANPLCGDAIAWTTDPGVNGCVALDFLGYPEGGSYRSPAVPTIDLGCLDRLLALRLGIG